MYETTSRYDVAVLVLVPVPGTQGGVQRVSASPTFKMGR